MSEQKIYPVPQCFHEVVTEVRKSRFIARVHPVRDRGEALAAVEAARRAFPDAGHHCWAYVVGEPGAATSAAMNDDGEPSGTAGKPILNVMEHKGLGDLVVVVIRYFGGTKLGAGGLVRAYAGATEAVLSSVPVVQAVPMARARLGLDFSLEQRLRHFLDQHQGQLDQVSYSEQVALTITLPSLHWPLLQSECEALGVTLEKL
ncbi:MAG: YigZ family protein [Oleiphilaceae bacterium]|nr:YigZ family protein [Oleiphilaceae bacterium]